MNVPYSIETSWEKINKLSYIFPGYTCVVDSFFMCIQWGVCSPKHSWNPLILLQQHYFDEVPVKTVDLRVWAKWWFTQPKSTELANICMYTYTPQFGGHIYWPSNYVFRGGKWRFGNFAWDRMQIGGTCGWIHINPRISDTNMRLVMDAE